MSSRLKRNGEIRWFILADRSHPSHLKTNYPAKLKLPQESCLHPLPRLSLPSSYQPLRATLNSNAIALPYFPRIFPRVERCVCVWGGGASRRSTSGTEPPPSPVCSFRSSGFTWEVTLRASETKWFCLF